MKMINNKLIPLYSWQKYVWGESAWQVIQKGKSTHLGKNATRLVCDFLPVHAVVQAERRYRLHEKVIGSSLFHSVSAMQGKVCPMGYRSGRQMAADHTLTTCPEESPIRSSGHPDWIKASFFAPSLSQCPLCSTQPGSFMFSYSARQAWTNEWHFLWHLSVPP